MKIGVLADTHDRLPAIRELLRQMAERGVGMVLHCGDYCAPFALQPFIDAHMSLAGVFGRNDGDREGLIAMAQRAMGAELFEGPHSMEIAGERILIVNDIGDVQARSLDAHTIVVHGCTHRQELKQRGDTLLVNPGEGCGWVYGTPGAAVIDLASKQAEFLSLTGAEWTN